MRNFQIKSAFRNYVIIEPMDKSSVLQTKETETVFKVISHEEMGVDVSCLEPGDLVIVLNSSVETTLMGEKEIYFVRSSDIVAVVESVTEDGQ